MLDAIKPRHLAYDHLNDIKLDKAHLEDIAYRMSAAIPTLEEVIIFGSRARGDNRPDSDVDIFLIVDDEGPSAWDVMAIANTALWGFDIDWDVVCRNRTDYERLSASPFNLEYAVKNEGVPIYE